MHSISFHKKLKFFQTSSLTRRMIRTLTISIYPIFLHEIRNFFWTSHRLENLRGSSTWRTSIYDPSRKNSETARRATRHSDWRNSSFNINLSRDRQWRSRARVRSFSQFGWRSNPVNIFWHDTNSLRLRWRTRVAL